MKYLSILGKRSSRNVLISMSMLLIGVFIGLINYFIFSFVRLFELNFSQTIVASWQTTAYKSLLIIEQIAFAILCVQLMALLIFLKLKDKAIINLKIIEFINVGLFIAFLISNTVYIIDLIILLYSGYFYEQCAFYNRIYGTHWWLLFLMMLLYIISPTLFAFKKIRKSVLATLIICLPLFSTFFIQDFVFHEILRTGRHNYYWTFRYHIQYDVLFLFIPIAILAFVIFKLSKNNEKD